MAGQQHHALAAELDEKTRTELEAAAFRRLVTYLRERADVQNIDLMNLAGFCRNCLAKWYQAAAEAQGQPIGYEAARELVKKFNQLAEPQKAAFLHMADALLTQQKPPKK